MEQSWTEPPAEIADLAQACVRFVHDALGFTLDYSPETLPVLDHYLREQVKDVHSEALELVASAAGAYFGEVVRRCIPGARWHSPAGDYRGHRLEFDPFFLWFNPVGAALEAATGEASEGWNAHFQVLDEARAAVTRALDAAAGVQPEDFYNLSMRLEALEHIADVLAGLESKQSKPRHFGPEVYRAACGDAGRASTN